MAGPQSKHAAFRNFGTSMIRITSGIFVLLTFALLLGAPRAAEAAESYDNCTGFITSLPAVISTQGTWCLKQDLSIAVSGIAITLNANNVTINCNDFKLTGMNQATGIYGMKRFNNTVRHCDIRG